MTAVRITKLERHEQGFYTANVTAAGHDTVRVDNRISCWTLTVDRKADFTSNAIRRREVLPDIAAALWKRVRAQQRGEAADETDVQTDRNGRPATLTLAEKMATAGLNAIKEAA